MLPKTRHRRRKRHRRTRRHNPFKQFGAARRRPSTSTKTPRAPTTKPQPQCSPSRRGKRAFTCFSEGALDRLRRAWNQSHPQNKIPSSYDGHELWEALNARMRDLCDDGNESCWIDQPFMRQKIQDGGKETSHEILSHTFTPPRPDEWRQKPYEWLSSKDIIDVMEQYMHTRPEFVFEGPVPIDFDKRDRFGKCLIDELCAVDLGEKAKEGYTKLGIVFNLDPHDKPGSHWVALFADITGGKIYYFDSYGFPPEKEIETLITRFMDQGRRMGKRMQWRRNTREHQRKNSECGVYCLYFIIRMLEGADFGREFLSRRIPDEEIHKYRWVFWRETHPKST